MKTSGSPAEDAWLKDLWRDLEELTILDED